MARFEMRLAFGVLVPIALAGCQTIGDTVTAASDALSTHIDSKQQEPPDALSANEIRTLTVGNTLTAYELSAGTTYRIYIAPNGEVDIRGTGWSDTGVWDIEKNTFCIRYKEIDGGQRVCGWFKPAGKSYETVPVTGVQNIVRFDLVGPGKQF